ncbi:MAG: hypothetical protein RR441_05830 [Longicatena sp.]
MENEKKEYGFFVNAELMLEGCYQDVDKEFMKTVKELSRVYGSDMDVYMRTEELVPPIIHEMILISENKITNKQDVYELRIIEKQLPQICEEEQ